MWVNESDDGYPKFNIVFGKSYFDEDKKEWVALKSFSDRDMLELGYLGQQVRMYCDEVRADNAAGEVDDEAALAANTRKVLV